MQHLSLPEAMCHWQQGSCRYLKADWRVCSPKKPSTVQTSHFRTWCATTTKHVPCIQAADCYTDSSSSRATRPGQAMSSSQPHLEPGAVVLVVAPVLALELPSRQVLLEGVGLVVEGPEQGLGVQPLVQRRVVQHRQPLVGVGLREAPWWDPPKPGGMHWPLAV